MRINRNVVSLVAIAALAFLAGRMELFSSAESLATASPADTKKPKKANVQKAKEKQDQEMPEEWAAYAEAGMPGKHHKLLDALDGNWYGEYRIWMAPGTEAMVSKGSIKRKLVLDGRFLYEKVEATSDMGSFEGIGYTGYNNLDGQYEMIWMDEMGTAMFFATGTYDPETKIFKSYGTMRDPVTAKVSSMSGEFDLSDPDRHTYVSYMTGPDGKEFKTFEGVMERVGGNK